VTDAAELRVLGGVTLHRGGDHIALGGPKAQVLLSVLVAHCDTLVSIDRLVDALWGDEPPKSAVGTVQSLVSRLRTVLEPDFTIAFGSGGYRLDVHDGEIDATRFESSCARARAAESGASLPILEAGLRLWHGPAFGDCADIPLVQGEARRLDELRLVATDEWAEARMESLDPASMVGELESLVTRHPLREIYWRLLMLALYRAGRQAEALRRASEFRTILRIEAGLDPSADARELEARILADDRSLLAVKDPPRSSSASMRRQQLEGVTSFVGRDPHVAALTSAIERQPLISITGPGGVGKTRLALRAAAEVMDEFADGLTVVELAAHSDPSSAPQAIARALDVQQQPNRSIETTLEEFLAPTQTLLVLDNCEHLVDTLAPLVDRLRSSCPRLRILTTSRSSLGLAGEYIEALDPLAIPLEDADDFGEIESCPAVELFVSRAAATTPGFELTEHNARSVAAICRRLGGLPLALELAAARLRTMNEVSLAERLKDRIEMPGQTQRGADGRLRSLHEMVLWSYELLTAEEQELFEQLAVFAGGFDPAAAEAVCALAGDRYSVLGLIASLVDKSMVLVDRRTARYQLLAPLREFGLDRLGKRGTVELTEIRHAAWFLDRAEAGAIGLDSADEARWSSELLRDYDNYRSAHVAVVRLQDADSALRLVKALREFAFRRVNYEITSWAQAATALDGAADHPDYSTALAIVAYGKFVGGDMRGAIDLGHRSLEHHRDSELSDTGLAERVLGNAYFYLAESDTAMEWMNRMLLSSRRDEAHGRLAQNTFMLSVACTSVGDGIRGAVLAGEARAAADASNSPTAHARADFALGLALESVEPEESLILLRRASVIAGDVGNRWLEAFALTEVHSLRAQQGELLASLSGYADVVDLWYRGGDWANQWLSLRRVLGIFAELGEHVSAAVLHGALTAMGAAQAMPIDPADAERLSEGVRQVQSLLGPASFADAVRQGTAMKDREIVTFVQQRIASLTSAEADD
jgi:predicted ATPase/DNA-binding SARP family transcriptional activator